MTSEGKSARELLQELITRWHEIAREVEAVGGPEIPKHVRMREGGRINSLLAELETFLTAIERESRLSIAAALEEAQLNGMAALASSPAQSEAQIQLTTEQRQELVVKWINAMLERQAASPEDSGGKR